MINLKINKIMKYKEIKDSQQKKKKMIMFRKKNPL